MCGEDLIFFDSRLNGPLRRAVRTEHPYGRASRRAVEKKHCRAMLFC